jgi:hypothetical protein
MGALIVLCLWHFFRYFWTCQSSHTHFTPEKNIVIILCWQPSINFYNLTPSSRRIRITMCYSSLVHVVSGEDILMLIVVEDNCIVNVKKVTTTGIFCAYGFMHIQHWGQMQKKIRTFCRYFLTYPQTYSNPI